jgi:hypothetical protein
MFALPAEVDENAYVVVLDPNFLDQASPTWWEVATFTQPRTRYVSNPPQVHVFRALSAETARQNLAAAQEAYASQPDAASLLDLFSAAASANEPQLAFEAWRELSTLDPDAARYKDQLIALFRQNLDTTEAGTNLLLNGDFGAGLEGWDLSEADALGIDVEMEGDAVHVVNAADQPAIPLSQSLHLKPETVYAFSVELKGQGDLAPLYWSHPDVEGSYPAELSAETYSHLVYIFITPVWEEYEPALLAPIAFLGAGEVWLRQASLTELGRAQ